MLPPVYYRNTGVCTAHSGSTCTTNHATALQVEFNNVNFSDFIYRFKRASTPFFLFSLENSCHSCPTTQPVHLSR